MTYIIAEIGINHNGSMAICKQLIDAAVSAGCDAVKFQKRTIDKVYTQEELARPRDSVFGTTNGDLKRGLEFGYNNYCDIDMYCKEVGIEWFASGWDENSIDFLALFEPPFLKLASPSLTDDHLLEHTASKGIPIILSTGMSDLKQIDHAVNLLEDSAVVLMHCVSAYPAHPSELNLNVIKTLSKRFNLPVGYSGHETGLASTVWAVVLGATVIERHITLDRSMWGSDQAASVEPHGFARLVRDIRAVEVALGDGVKRLEEREIPNMQKLRRV